ncbi:MAG TPA: AEC family transporter [Clostridiales bacterium]|jgi:predicted permease|nr:AEC family transporter [Clostridiales bacterium]
MEVFSQIMVLMLLMLCGFVAKKRDWISEEGIKGLNQMVMLFALPSLSFVKLQVDKDPKMMKDLMSTLLLGAALMLLFGLIAYNVFRKESPKRRAVFTGMAMFGNPAFMGFPLVAAAFGEDMLIYGVMFVAAFNLLIWSAGVRLLVKDGASLLSVLKIPSMVASILGLLFYLLGIRLPSVLNKTMEYLGSLTTPLALFVIGTSLTKLQPSALKDKGLLLACLLRLVITPLLALAIMYFLPLSREVKIVTALLVATPAAASFGIMVENYGGDAPLSAQGIAFSTLLSGLTIPVLLPLFLKTL